MRTQLILLCTILWTTFGSASAFAGSKPKLVVVLAIDQLRSDYLSRFEHQYLPASQKSGKPGGFRYLMKKGAYFKNAQLGHALSVTGLGHATMLTGAYPYLHGIVAHKWYDPEIKKRRYCAEDSEHGKSPRQLLVSTVGDELKNATAGKALVGSVALKDRSAIFMGGHRADLALWYDEKKEGFTTSSHYTRGQELPAWLSKWNNFDYYEKKVPRAWNKLLPESMYALSTAMPPESVANMRGLGKSFPHPLKTRKAFVSSPWGNAYVLDTALEMIREMGFGKDDVPDVVGVSLSAFDALGHNFGFPSPEMQDAALRTDRMLADFLSKLQRLIPGGLKNATIVLTSDHGVSMNPVLANRLKLPGGFYDPEEMLKTIAQMLREKFDLGENDKPVADFNETHVYLDRTVLKNKFEEAAQAVVNWLREQPFVAAAYTRAALLNGQVPPTLIAQKLSRNVHPLRSGDVMFAPRPGHMHVDDKRGTGGADHEGSSVQDASIPLIFVGKAFKAGTYHDEVFLNDLAPTLSAILGVIPPSGSEGRVLSKIIR